MGDSRTSINVRNEHYEKLSELARELDQPKAVILDTLLSYALKRARVKRVIALEFSAGPASEMPLAALSENGTEAAAPQESEESEEPSKSHVSFKEYPKSDMTGAEVRRHILDILQEIGPSSAAGVRTKFRERFNSDPGNMNSFLDTCVRLGHAKADRTQLPYVFSVKE